VFSWKFSLFLGCHFVWLLGRVQGAVIFFLQGRFCLRLLTLTAGFRTCYRSLCLNCEVFLNYFAWQVLVHSWCFLVYAVFGVVVSIQAVVIRNPHRLGEEQMRPGVVYAAPFLDEFANWKI